jgi:hypothetical protein
MFQNLAFARRTLIPKLLVDLGRSEIYIFERDITHHVIIQLRVAQLKLLSQMCFL